MSKVDVDEIRRQMAQIRREIHADVSNVVVDVEEALDWRAPIRSHPYVALGVGLLAGYFLVPRRKSKVQAARRALADLPPEAIAEVAPRIAAVSRPEPARNGRPEPRKSPARRLLSWGVGMAWPLVSQAAQSYAAMWLEDQIKQQMNPIRKPPGEPARHPSSARPAGPYEAVAARSARQG